MSILIINPNSSVSMTKLLEDMLAPLQSPNTTYTFFTAPSGPASINNPQDGIDSAKACITALRDLIDTHDAFLVACYSAHPLVPELKQITNKPVVGIFEASVGSALMLLGPDEKFGIVSTGKVWEELLGTAVRELLGGESESPRFGGVRTTGLSAKELHDLPADVVRERMVDATRRLLRGGDVRVVCLGCAGMVGMNDIVREAAILELGQKGHKVHIVDGVLAGASILRSFVRSS